MFVGSNGNPVFPVLLEENQFQCDFNALTQLQLFGNFAAGVNVDPVNYAGNDVVALSRPSKIRGDEEDISRQQKPQIFMNNFFQEEADQPASVLNPTAVSTGLRLSYDDDEHNSSITSASIGLTTLPIIKYFGDNLKNEIESQKEEFDHYIRVQEEQMVKGIREMKQRHLAAFVSAIEKGISRKLREKELEIENINRKNKELAERLKQVAMEAQSWQYRTHYYESMVNVLKSSIKQAMALGARQTKEGCGDGEVDDAASSCLPNAFFNGNPHETISGNKGLSGQITTCKACKSKEISMLLLPCRHVCLCKDCEGFIDLCPVCNSMKTASVQVYVC